ncbi:hypothetical protein ACQPWY_28120 [Pseudonocardia xinjiangensis]
MQLRSSPDEVVAVDGVLVTSVARTVADVARACRSRVPSCRPTVHCTAGS